MLTNELYDTTLDYCKIVPKDKRKAIAQYFTPPNISVLMSELFTPKRENVRILDVGSGTGILGGSVIDKLIKHSIVKKIYIVFYEIDLNVIPVLRNNIEKIKERIATSDIDFSYKIIQEDFILSNKDYWQENQILEEKDKFDLIISNPPFKKIKKDSEEALLMKSIVFGQPNLYSLFLAMSVIFLKNDGELIFLIPRSFTSGLYFKKFREFFLTNMTITELNLFNSRRNIFGGEKVLQEFLILKAKKNNTSHSSIKIKMLEGEHLKILFNKNINSKYLISDKLKDRLIFVPTSEQDLKTLKIVNSLKYNLEYLGFSFATGKIVDFRSSKFLFHSYKSSTVPLIWSSHLKDNKIIFPLNQFLKPQYIINEEQTMKWLFPLQNDYLLIKRFSTKEEARRLQCFVLKKDDLNFKFFGLENHLNVLTKLDGLIHTEELYGLFVLFNSSLIDNYFRILSGTTQVNANDLKSIPLPSLKKIKLIGSELIKSDKLDVEICDDILSNLLFN